MASGVKFAVKIPKKLGTKDKSFIGRVHRTIKKVTDHINNYEFNMAIASIMELTNNLNRSKDDLSREVYDYAFTKLIIMLAPFTPHVCEELWEQIGGNGFISITNWPKYKKELIDEKAEALDDSLSKVIGDVNEIIKLVNKKPQRISIFISEAWKYKLIDLIIKAKDKHDFKSIMNKAMSVELIKSHGSEASKIIQSISRDLSKLIPVSLNQADEIRFFNESKELIEKEFECKAEIIKAEDSKENKARSALPGKPGILIS